MKIYLCLKTLNLRFVSAKKNALNIDEYAYFNHYANINFVSVTQRLCASGHFLFPFNLLPRNISKGGMAYHFMGSLRV